MVESTLAELLVRAEGATSLHSNKDGIPPIKQGLASLQQRTANLAFSGQTVQGTEQALSKARQFLPQGHTDDISRLVSSLERKPAFQPVVRDRAPGQDMDLDTFLRNEQARMIQQAINEAQEAAEAAAHRAEIQWEEEDWREAKLDFRKAKQMSAGTMLLEQTLALTSQFDRPRGGMGNEGFETGAVDMEFNPAPLLVARKTTKLSEVQLEYATRVGQATTDGTQEVLANLLCTASERLVKDSQGVSSDAGEFQRTLKLLRTMLEVVDDNTGRYRPKVGPGMAVEQLRETLAISAREHLEREIYEIVVNRVDKMQREGRLRRSTEGAVGILEGYVEFRSPSGQGKEDQRYEVLYWCLRTGHLEAVSQFANSNRGYFPEEVREVLAALHEVNKYGQQRQPMLSQAVGRVKDVLSRRQESADVFERAVLNLLAFDNPSKVDKTRVVQITEDYLWHCLWFAMPWNPANSEVGATGRFTMFDLAAKILRWGEQYFDPDGGRAFLYARILFICQLFREGVLHLYKSKHLEAVHTSLLLDHYGIFKDLSLPDTAPRRGYVMNIEDMVLGYVKDFQDTDGDKAADYLLLLKPLARARKLIEALLEATDESGLEKLTTHLKTKNFQMTTWSQQGGVQQEFWGPDQAMEVIRTAAITAERSLSSRKALALYKLAQDDNGALRVLINQLCQVVVTPNSDRETWWKEVDYFKQKLQEERYRLDANLVGVLQELEMLYQFFDRFDAGDYENVKAVYENLSVYPKTPESYAVDEAVSRFLSCSIEFKRVLGEVAARAMRVFLKLFQDRKREAAQDRPTALSRDGLNYQLAAAQGPGQEARQVQQYAKALLKWALDTRVSRDLPSEIISRIQRMEAMIM